MANLAPHIGAKSQSAVRAKRALYKGQSHHPSVNLLDVSLSFELTSLTSRPPFLPHLLHFNHASPISPRSPLSTGTLLATLAFFLHLQYSILDLRPSSFTFAFALFEPNTLLTTSTPTSTPPSRHLPHIISFEPIQVPRSRLPSKSRRPPPPSRRRLEEERTERLVSSLPPRPPSTTLPRMSEPPS